MIKDKTIEKVGWNLDNSYSKLPVKFYTRTDPTSVKAPKLVIINHLLARSLGLDPQALQSNESLAVLAGNYIPEGAFPIAQAYAGHQYGNFTMLGDGRAVLLSEQITPQGKRFDIQLKGAGKTPFSRGGDGRAALGPMLREYIISEAMNALDIPTTRSLAVLTTGEMVRRERDHLGAILTRVAASHIRVGTFEYIAEWGTVEELKELADYTIKRHYPDIEFTENKYLSLLQEVIRCQASLISKWQLVGFIHGVMNTDNMTISGETIDYGPCAFMDEYNPATVFSSIDIYGRYAYGNQPDIAAWNLARLAETLLPLIHPNQEEAIKIAQDTISGFYDLYRTYWLSGMKAKLGIYEEGLEDESLIEELLDIMKKYKADYTNTFRALTLDELKDSDLFVSMEFTQWYDMWQKRLKSQKGNICPHELMMKSNPSVIPRNHRVEEALDAAIKQENYSLMERLLDVISNPFDYSFEHDQYTIPPEPTLKPYQTYCGT